MEKGKSIRAKKTKVLVASAGKELGKERLKLCGVLWAEGISCEMFYEENPKPER